MWCVGLTLTNNSFVKKYRFEYHLFFHNIMASNVIKMRGSSLDEESWFYTLNWGEMFWLEWYLWKNFVLDFMDNLFLSLKGY